MKILKLKSNLFSLMAIAMVTVFLSSCEKDYVNVQPNEHINEITTDQLKKSQQLWNEKFSEKITFLNYEYVGTIENELDKQDVLKNIADEAKIVATGDLNQPESVKVELLTENSAKANITKENLRKYIKDAIKINNKIIALNWDKDGEQFTTYCIANKEGIVWDNILGGVMTVESEIKEGYENSGSNKKGYWNSYSHKWWLNYFWGSRAGEMGYTIIVYHNDGRVVTNTKHESYASMDLGKGISKSKVLVSSGLYGKVQYALAITGPGGSVSFDNCHYKATANGWNKVANGTKILYPRIP